MKNKLLIGLFLMIAITLVIGCSDDDDCTTCPTLTQEGVAFAMADIYDGDVEFYCMMYDIDGSYANIDSVYLDDFKLEVRQYFGEGLASYAHTEEGDITGYSSGDSITFTIYAPNGVSQSSVDLLDYDTDRPLILDWEYEYPYDTVALNTEVTVTWSTVASADFYAVDWEYNHNNSGANVRSYYNFTTTDTSFTIPASALDYNGRLYIDIVAVTGPDLNDPSSFTGDIFEGRFNSIAGEYMTIYVGDGNPYPESAQQQDEEVGRKSLKEYFEIINQ